MQLYVQAPGPGNMVVLDLVTGNGRHYASFGLWVPDPNEKLVSGTYTFEQTQSGLGNPLTFSYGDFGGYVDETYSAITGGEITVEVTGDTYTVEIDCMADQQPFTGTYTGVLHYDIYDGEEIPSGGKPEPKPQAGPVGGTMSVGVYAYDMISGLMTYHGNYEPAESQNVSLLLTAKDGEALTLEFWVPGSNDRLVAGTYTFTPGSTEQFTIGAGSIYSSGADWEVTEGTVAVESDGVGYIFRIDLSSQAGKISGELLGTPGWTQAK
jgi:hypothetical protein